MKRRNLVGGMLATTALLPGSRFAAGSATPTPPRVLLASFSRAGENYYYGDRIDLEIGNTEVVAGMIDARLDAAIYRIEAQEPYSDSYDETVARNVQEQDADARPAIANPLNTIAPYDIILVGSPIWNVRPPMIISTFLESFDFSGKTIYPFVTYAVSGLGRTLAVYETACPNAIIGSALAIRGEEATQAQPAVDDWLSQVGLL